MFCVKCGSEMANDSQLCPKCGNVVNPATGDAANSNERKRHGFTSFWLIFQLISYFIAGSIYIFSSELITQYLDVSDEIIVLLGIVSILGIIGDILLLCWKKNGFWVIVGVSIVSLFVNTLIGLSIGQILFGLVGIAILWGVLHIHKNGKTTWEQLI